MTTTAILDVADLHGYYGKSHVLQGVALTVGEGELVTLLGRNGAGKSTTLKAIAGVVTPRGGQERLGVAPPTPYWLPLHLRQVVSTA